MSVEITKGSLPETLLQEIAQYIEQRYLPPMLALYCEQATAPSGERPHRLHRKRAEVCGTVEKSLSLEDVLKQEDAGFTETLLKRIDETGKKDAEIYKRAGLTKQHFSKIRNNPNYRPTKPTAVALAIALELSLEQTRDLIGRAGYALTNSSKFDLIVRYFIEQGSYDVMEINLALYEFDQPLLGG